MIMNNDQHGYVITHDYKYMWGSVCAFLIVCDFEWVSEKDDICGS